MNGHFCEHLFGGYDRCNRPAKYFENDKWLCGLHAPSRKGLKRKKGCWQNPEWLKRQIEKREEEIEIFKQELSEYEPQGGQR